MYDHSKRPRSSPVFLGKLPFSGNAAENQADCLPEAIQESLCPLCIDCVFLKKKLLNSLGNKAMRRKRTSVSRKKAGRTAFVVTGSRLFVLSQVLLPAMAQNATSVPIDRPVGGPLDFLEDTVNATLPSNPSPSETTAAPVSVPVGSVAISNETTSSPQALPITTTAPISAASAPSTNAPTQSPVAQPQGGASTNGTSFTSAPAVSFSGGSTNSPVSSLDLCGGLDCQHDSTCRLGNATYNMDTHVGFHTVTNMNGYHCQCPEGFGGLDCSRPYQECGINGARCYHGGVCLPESELEDIEYASYCECSKASHNGQRYAGKYCEVAVEQENYCNDRSRLFCLNGGSCPTGDMLICSCKEGYFGEHCEYVTPKGPECTLECLNEGVCKVGRVNGPWGNRDDFYCDCPRGYGGIQCEHLAETCGDGDTVCLHGASCQTAVAANGKTSFTCSCPDPYLGGSGCEQKRRMELCNPQVAPEYSLSMAVPAFCLNGGTCGDLVTSEFVCVKTVIIGRHEPPLSWVSNFVLLF